MLVLMSAKLYSQNQARVSTPFKVVDAKHKYYFNQGNNVLSVKVDGKKMTLQLFNTESMTEIERNEDYLPDGAVFEMVIEFNHKIYLMYSLWDRENFTEQLFAKTIDPENARFLDGENLLLQHKGRVIEDMSYKVRYNLVNKFSFRISYDQTCLLVQFVEERLEKRDEYSYDKIGLYVFNQNLELISEKVITLPYSEMKSSVIDYAVDSEGNSYLLVLIFNDNSFERIKKGGTLNYHFELMRVRINSDEIGQFKITDNDKFIQDIWIFECPQNYMICTGYYFNHANKVSTVDGIFTFKFKDDDITDYEYYEFPKEIAGEKAAEKNVKKKSENDSQNPEMKELKLMNYFMQEDGSIILISEQSYVDAYYTASSSGGGYVSYEYRFNFMLISKIDSNGKPVWIKILPKRQTGSNRQGDMSYRYIEGKNCHYLLFIDNKKNFDIKENENMWSHFDGYWGCLAAYKVDDTDGEFKKYNLFDLENVNDIKLYQFDVNRIVQTDKNKIAVELYKKKKEDVYVKVSLP